MVLTTWCLGRRPALDGIRAVAVMAVVMDHTHVPGFDGGGLGVDVFFGLSGFLITSLLVEELLDTDAVSLPRFWGRRALRLIPALAALVAVVAVLMPIMPWGTDRGVVPTLLYVTNWHRALVGDVGALGHTWSLGIEEQFYLLWPLVLIGLFRLDRSLGAALRCTLVVAGAVAVLREVAMQTDALPVARVYNGFDFRADALLVGCALSLAIHARRLPAWMSSPRVVSATLVALGAAFIGREWGAPLAAERTFAAATTAMVIAAAVVGSMPRLTAALAHPAMRWIGVRSYALYLWHYPVCRVVLDDDQSLVRVVIAVALSVAFAAASYRFVEAPFLRLKDRLARPGAQRPRRGAAMPPLGPAERHGLGPVLAASAWAGQEVGRVGVAEVGVAGTPRSPALHQRPPGPDGAVRAAVAGGASKRSVAAAVGMSPMAVDRILDRTAAQGRRR